VAGQQHPRGNPVWLDDHSRYALSLTAHRRITGPIVVEEFRNTYERQGIPYSTLTDNGMVFTTRFAGVKAGELRPVGSEPIGYPQDCGRDVVELVVEKRRRRCRA
jgi:hypothetical protein